MSLASEKSHDTQSPRYRISGAVHVLAGEGPTTWFAGDTYTIKASRESTNGSLGLVDATVPPGGGPIAHIHTRTDEAFYILSGQLEILDGARSFIASPGATNGQGSDAFGARWNVLVPAGKEVSGG